MKPTLLFIDDDREFVADFSLLLEQDYNCLFAPDGTTGKAMITEKTPDVVLLDLMLGEGVSGIDILKDVLKTDPEIPIIMITDYASVDTAVQAIKLGAFDYISKTSNRAELKLVIEKSLQQQLLRLQKESLEHEIEKAYGTIVGVSPAIQAVKDQIALAARFEAIVLITGESGVGKELVARQIYSQSDRASKPFVAINCAAIPKELLESELFGHEKGAFTGAHKRTLGKFELAADGMIFLDEISELALEAQVKILRVLQEREFHRVGGETTLTTQARIVAATNRNLDELAKEGRFREDLYYRINVMSINVSPIRKRKEDIPILLQYFLQRASMEMNIPLKKFSRSALEVLQEYGWPGNVREIQNIVTRLAILSRDTEIIPDDLVRRIIGGSSEYPTVPKVPKTWIEMDKMRKESAERASREVEKAFLSSLLKRFDGNISRAAEHIGMNRTNLHKMIKKCGLDEEHRSS